MKKHKLMSVDISLSNKSVCLVLMYSLLARFKGTLVESTHIRGYLKKDKPCNASDQYLRSTGGTSPLLLDSSKE